VRAIEGTLETRHAGPRIQLVTPDMVGNTDLAETLAPASFIPVFELD
jgi:protein TorT